MAAAKIAPCGTWKSPISAELIAAETVGLGQIVLDGDDIYLGESRPAEGGRTAIVRIARDGRTEDMLPAPFDARSRVHEYGGGAFAVARGVIYFVNYGDQRVYRKPPGEAPRPLTPEDRRRYADLVVDVARRRLLAVCEDHRTGGEPVNSLVAIDLADGRVRPLAEGADFYSTPRLAPDGRRLAWLAWYHPHMPWDGSELWLAAVRDDGTLGDPRLVAGGPEESVFQPEFGPDGALYFVSDRSHWWNLYRVCEPGSEALAPLEAEFGVPQWRFGLSTYDFLSGRELVCAYCRDGTWQLAVLDLDTRRLDTVKTPYTEISGLRAADGRAYFIGSSATEPAVLVACDLAVGRVDVRRRSSRVQVDPGYLSVPETLAFPTAKHETAYGFFYPPRNRDFVVPPGEKPPLLVFAHGGPTAAASGALDLKIQYWTSRGFAVLDVNYRGSSGYGCAYREKLAGRWGIADVEDCVNGARYLIEHGRVDPERVAIRGASAGGYTALAALASGDLFRAGASYYGVSELALLARDTHKFEKHYLDRLLGPYPARRDLYEARSPLHRADRIRCPVIFFQGLEDKVVPPDQTERMVHALRKNGVPVAYVLFQDESHGFRKAANIKRALEGEQYFYSKVFGFTPADELEPVKIVNR